MHATHKHLLSKPIFFKEKFFFRHKIGCVCQMIDFEIKIKEISRNFERKNIELQTIYAKTNFAHIVLIMSCDNRKNTHLRKKA